MKHISKYLQFVKESRVNEAFYRIPHTIAANELYELTNLIKSINDRLETGQDANPKDFSRVSKLWDKINKSIKKFKSKEDVEGTVYEGEILVWDEIGKPFEDLKNALDKIGKENTDPKWSKALISIWKQIEKAETNLNNYDKKLGVITTESVNEAKEIEVTQEMWDKDWKITKTFGKEYDEHFTKRMEAAMSKAKDEDMADNWAYKNWKQLPGKAKGMTIKQ